MILHNPNNGQENKSRLVVFFRYNTRWKSLGLHSEITKRNHYMSLIKKLNPAVKKPWLYLLSGISWSAIGIMLAYMSTDWLDQVSKINALVRVFLGVLLALIIFRFGFTRFAQSNIERIKNKAQNSLCVFGFQKWSSYPLVLVMISLGIFLRKYSPIPKPWLAILYIGIGGGLFLSSYWYYHTLYEDWKTQRIKS